MCVEFLLHWSVACRLLNTRLANTAQVAATLFASPPLATFDEAIAHFLAAEAIEPGFYPKNLLMLAQAYKSLGNTAEAREWQAKCLNAVAHSPEDEQTLTAAAKLKL